MKKSKVEFVSAECNPCLLKSSFGYCSNVVWSWCILTSHAVQVWHSAASLKLQTIQFLVASAELGCTWERPSCAPSPAFTSTRPRAGSAKVPRHHRICLSLPLPAGQLSILITKMSVSERTSDGIGKLGPLNLPWWGGAIQTSRKMVGVFHHPIATCLSLFWIISLNSAGWISL